MYLYHSVPGSRNKPDPQLRPQLRDRSLAHRREPDAAGDNKAFGNLTAQLILAQHDAGTLNRRVLEALLMGVGLEVQS